MEGLAIMAVLAVVCYGALWLLTRRTRRKLAQVLSTTEQQLNVTRAKLRAAEEHATTVRTQVLGWDQPAQDVMPPRVWMLPMPDRVRPAEEILAELPGPRPIRSWRDSVDAKPVEDEPSPLYAETLAAIPIVQPEADVLTAAIREPEPARLDMAELHDVEPDDPDEQLPQDEARITKPRRDDDTDPPASQDPPTGADGTPDSPPADVTRTEPLAAVAAHRYDWSQVGGPVAPMHGARPHPSLARGARWMASRTSWWRRLPHRLGAWWAENLAIETGQGWAPHELGDGHPIARHRRGGGTWQVA